MSRQQELQDRKERYEERAAIIEEGCKVSRTVAEAMARQHEEKLQAQERHTREKE